MKVLFLTHRLPYAPNRGDRIRAYHLIRTLAPRTSLEVVSLVHDDQEMSRVDDVRALGARVTAVRTSPVRGYASAAISLPGSKPLTHALLDAPGIRAALAEIVRERRPDVVLAYCSGMARFAFEAPLDGLPVVIDFVDIDSEKWAALGKTSAWPKRVIYRREARTLGRFEAEAANRARASLVVTERERVALRQIAPDANVHVIGNGVSLEHLRPAGAPTETPRVVFCGVMDYQPNVDGVLWFAREIWPQIRRRVPGAEFVVVGANPVASVQQLAGNDSGIVVTGTVPDVREYLWDAAMSVAPLLTARGLQNKVLEALAAGLPAIVTPQVWDGLPAAVYAGCQQATTPEQFGNSVSALLLATGRERRDIAARADLTSLDWDRQLEPVYGLLEAARNRS